MKVSELIDRLQACDLDAEILLQVDRRMFAPPTWVGIMDTNIYSIERMQIALYE